MRQYWRDYDSLERMVPRTLRRSRSGGRFIRESGGTGFWHEAYYMRGGMEVDLRGHGGGYRIPDLRTELPARGAMFSARERSRVTGLQTTAAPLTEAQLYSR